VRNLIRKYGIEAAMGLLAAALTFGLGPLTDGLWIFTLIPGMFISAAISGNFHARQRL
jgi:hypothetical protein